MTFDISKLPKRMHARVLELHAQGNQTEIKKIFLYHKVIHCDSCANATTLREWLNYWKEMGILAVGEAQEERSGID